MNDEQGGFSAGRDFLLYAASQFFSCLGDAFQTVALAILIFELTGSGLYAGIGAIFPLLSGIFVSPFAGLLGDRFPAKRLLFVVGFLKGIAVMLFAVAGSLWFCYAMICILSVVNVLYGIPGRKITASIVPRKNLLVGNSLLTGLTGAAYFVGPALAGLAVKCWGTGEAMMICGSLDLLSSFIIPFLHVPRDGKREKAGEAGASPVEEIREGLRFCLNNRAIRQAVIALAAISFGSASTNMAFYTYSFDILGTSATQWGSIVSVFNGVMILSTALAIFARKRMRRSFRLFILLPCLGIAAAWLCYSALDRFAAVLPALALEGTCYYFAVTLLTTRLQLASDMGHMARALAANDICANAARLLGMGAAGVIMRLFSVPAVFSINAALLVLFALAGLLNLQIHHNPAGLPRRKLSPDNQPASGLSLRH